MLYHGQKKALRIMSALLVNGIILWTVRIAISIYRKTSSTSRSLVGNKIIDNSDVVGASPVGAAPTTYSFST